MYAWDIPRYSPTEAGRLAEISPGRVRRWIRGYDYSYSGPGAKTPIKVHQDPVIQQPASKDALYASFLDLVDLFFVRQFIEFGHSLQQVRKALAEAESILSGHHFAQKRYFTDGSRIYLRIKEKGADNLLQLLSGGQWVIADVIKQIAKQVDFDQKTGFAERWYPEGHDGRVIVDPRICFGFPCIEGRAVRTANIYDLYAAESKNENRVAAWLDLPVEDVGAAIKYEQALAA